MAKRKALSKKLRFEVFKRDAFKCQYCGRSAPDVVLEVDHIIPVSKGGTDDITNLITTCRECNAGKGARMLDDSTTIEKQRRQLEKLNERREQLRMMAKWREELLALDEEKVRMAEKHFQDATKYSLTPTGREHLRKWIKKFPLDLILECIEISTTQYLEMRDGKYTPESVEKAFSYIPKICQVKQASMKKPYLQQLLYIRAILRNRLNYCNLPMALRYLESAYLQGTSLDELTRIAQEVRNWTEFRETMDSLLDYTEEEE